MFVDGELAGTSPLERIWLEIGMRRLRLTLPDHVPLEQDVELARGVEPALDFKLVHTAAPGHLVLQGIREGSAVTIDEQPMAAPVDGEPIEVSAKRHNVRVVAEGYAPFLASVDVSPGARVVIRVEALPLPEIPTAKPEEPTPPTLHASPELAKTPHDTPLAPTSAWVAGGASIVAVACGALLFSMASSAADETSGLASGADASAWRDKRDEANDRVLMANVSFGVAGAAALTAGVLVWLHHRDDSSGDANAAAAIVPVNQGAGAVLVLPF